MFIRIASGSVVVLEKNVNAPVDDVENGERSREDESRIFVNQIDIFDFRYGVVDTAQQSFTGRRLLPVRVPLVQMTAAAAAGHVMMGCRGFIGRRLASNAAASRRRRALVRMIGPELMRLRTRMVVVVVVMVVLMMTTSDEPQTGRTHHFGDVIVCRSRRTCQCRIDAAGGSVSISQRRNGRHPQIVQLNDSIVATVLLLVLHHGAVLMLIRTIIRLPLLQKRIKHHFFPSDNTVNDCWNRYLFLSPSSPKGVIDGGVFQQGGKDEDETHDQIDVDGFDVADARQRGAHSRRYGRHSQHSRDSLFSNW